MGVDAAQVDRLSVHNADKEPGFEYIPPKCSVAFLQRYILAGKVASITPYLVPATPA